jgi:hypothetical protein
LVIVRGAKGFGNPYRQAWPPFTNTRLSATPQPAREPTRMAAAYATAQSLLEFRWTTLMSARVAMCDALAVSMGCSGVELSES